MSSFLGVMRMIAIATKTPNVSDIIGSIAWKVQSRGVSDSDTLQICNYACKVLHFTAQAIRAYRAITSYL